MATTQQPFWNSLVLGGLMVEDVLAGFPDLKYYYKLN